MGGEAVYKVVWFGRFRDGTDRDEAWRYLRDEHGPVVGGLPLIDAYAQSYATKALTQASIGAGFAPGPSHPPLRFDSYACGWYRDEAVFREFLRSADWQRLCAVAERVFDPSSYRGWSAIVDPQTIIDEGGGPLKTVYVMRFKEEIRRDPQRVREAHDYWTTTHGHRYGRQVPGISRYVQNHVVAPLGVDGPDESIQLEMCGFSECWFENEAAHELAMGSPEWLAMNKDAENLFEPAFSLAGLCAFVEESIVTGRDASARG
jgi:hypothetical protein